MTPQSETREIDLAFAVRFVAFGIVMASANIMPYLESSRANITDGLVVAGWPFWCYEAGGVAWHVVFDPWALAGDIVIAVVVSGFAAWLFRNGIIRTIVTTFRKCQTWGTPFADQSTEEPDPE